MVLTDPIKRISQIKTFKKQLKGIPYENIISLDETSTTKKESLSDSFSRNCEKIKTLFLFSQYRYSFKIFIRME